MVSPNSAQPRPAQASPSLSVGLAKALPKAFAYWIQMWRFRPPGGIGFGPFLAPLRLAVLEGPCLVRSWRAKVPPSRAKHARLCHGPAQLQLSLAESSLAVGLSTPASDSPAQELVWALPKAVPDAPFSAAVTLRFWCVFGSFGAAVPLRFPVLEVLGPSLAV